MAERGCVDNPIQRELDYTKTTAFVESQLTSVTEKELIKTVTGHLFNNTHHVGGNTLFNTRNVASRPEHNAVSVQGYSSQPHVVNPNRTNPNSPFPINTSMKSSIGNLQIMGIPSFINADTHINATSLSNSSTQPIVSKLSNISTTNCNNRVSPFVLAHNTVQASNVNPYDSVASQRSTAVRSQQPLNIANIYATAAMQNLATIAAEQQKPLTVLANGSTHIQTLQNKDKSVIPQYILKGDSNSVKRELSVPNSMHEATPLIPRGHHQIIKGGTNDRTITVQAHAPISQQHVVQVTIATATSTLSSTVQAINTSKISNPSIKPAIRAQIQPAHIRISNQVRTHQPNLAHRQQTPQASPLTIPQGSVLMRNSSGQLVLVSAPPSGFSSVGGTSMAGGSPVQNNMPLSTQARVRAPGSNETIVTIQPQGSSLSSQQHTGTVVPATSLQHSNGLSLTAANQSVALTVNSGAISATGEMSKAMVENVKKCKNFLSTLIRLSHSQPAEVVKNVRALIQGLIDGKVEPEVFTERLQQELQSSPQPYLISFLKKNLPFLRHCMKQGQMTIEGIKPPPAEVIDQVTAQSLAPTSVLSTQKIITAAGTRGQQDVMAAQATLTPSQQMPLVHAALGPASSKVAPAEKNVHQQLTVAPGENKVVVLPLPQQAQIQARPKLVARSALQATQSIRPASSTAVIKAAPFSSPPGQKEKRKFESSKDGDDDINDVATMGGVNLSEESRNILATTNADFIGAQSRSCKDEVFLAALPLFRKVASVAKKFGIDEVGPAVINLVSHAVQERLRDMVSKLSTIAEHRMEIYKVDSRYEVESESRQKLKFLEVLDKLEKERRDDQEKEKLRKVAKSRSKTEDPEQLKLIQRAKELQQAEAEERQQRQTNLTALEATLTSKKRRLDFLDSSKGKSTLKNGLVCTSGSSSLTSMMRPRMKRVNMRDVQLLLEKDSRTRKSDLLYRTFIK